MRQLLKLLCLFNTAAAVWLIVMENVLRHPGYGERSFVALAIALQSLATLLFPLREQSWYRTLVTLGGVGLTLLGGSALVRVFQPPHFEGFVLVIAAALVIQGSLTLAATVSKHNQIGA